MKSFYVRVLVPFIKPAITFMANLGQQKQVVEHSIDM